MISEQEILNAKILIVDDLEANESVLGKILSEVGYLNISTAMNPADINELHQTNVYDLILLDIQIPNMDGFQVVEALSSNQSDNYRPILAIIAEPDQKLQALAAGAKDFITKPFDITEVNARIHNLLEVRLLYKKLGNYKQELEQTVMERTAELRLSKARYRSLVELASDWYWEQDEQGTFTQISGPVREMLGVENEPLADQRKDNAPSRWNESERTELRAKIASRQPFLDFVFSRINADGSQQKFQVSGEPMFNPAARFIGYRGFGVELMIKNNILEQGN
jgi:PAS domain S-box-containing protein